MQIKGADMSQKRSIVTWSDDQYEMLKEAAKAVGLTVPQYCKVSTLNNARVLINSINGKEG